MTVYAYNDNGTFRLMASLPTRLRLPDGFTRTSLDELDEKQLAELGIYPAVEVKAEYATATQYLGSPTYSFDGTTVTATYPVVEKSKEQIAEELVEAKTAKLAELAQARWEQETGGLTLESGAIIKTDRESQGLLTAAAVMAKFDPTMVVEWKAATGWLDLDAETVIVLAGAVREHVQKCFSRERDLAEAVSVCSTVAEVDTISW